MKPPHIPTSCTKTPNQCPVQFSTTIPKAATEDITEPIDFIHINSLVHFSPIFSHSFLKCFTAVQLFGVSTLCFPHYPVTW